ncbi:MFS transporter [Paenibacillus humicola]|uniref:MFS transporter n=1 Tax=Paenibacillus humicola TaxID=3110540 RepID=UPI00237BC047|nr:MFS transporter [Paenibacillus humicola]
MKGLEGEAAVSLRKPLPLRTGFFYGWLMVAIGGLGIFFSGPGQTYSNAVFIESYIRDLKMDRTAVSTIYSAATLTSGLLLFIMGRLVDRFGRRIMLTAAALLLGAACWFNSVISGPVMLFAGFFMIRYFGQGSMTLIPNTLVSQWFMKYRGRALSFAGLGGLLGAAVFPPVVNALIETLDWRPAWRILGILLIVVFAPIAYIFVRNRPEDAGLLPDGAAAAPAGSDGNPSVPAEDSWTLREAMRTRAFWLIMICGAIPAAVYTGITFQIFSILGEQGIDRTATSFVLSLIPLVSFGCSLVSGFIAERVNVSRMLALTFVMNIAAPLVLMFAHSYAAVLLFAVSWGIAQGVMNIPMGLIWPNYYGRRYLGSIQSVTTTATVIGSALGPIPFGWSYDRFGSYNLMLAASIVIWLIGAVLAFLAAPPRRRAAGQP